MMCVMSWNSWVFVCVIASHTTLWFLCEAQFPQSTPSSVLLHAGVARSATPSLLQASQQSLEEGAHTPKDGHHSSLKQSPCAEPHSPIVPKKKKRRLMVCFPWLMWFGGPGTFRTFSDDNTILTTTHDFRCSLICNSLHLGCTVCTPSAVNVGRAGATPPRSGHRNCRNVPERFAGTL